MMISKSEVVERITYHSNTLWPYGMPNHLYAAARGEDPRLVDQGTEEFRAFVLELKGHAAHLHLTICMMLGLDARVTDDELSAELWRIRDARQAVHSRQTSESAGGTDGQASPRSDRDA